ncbi:hypothetical protein ACJMK2_041396 [Sinanodonta woodiana]|uniref:Amino acid transporter n=1 Tax=Sinanodonta woodiana TaxID=1069815 RepID=A0ABD3W407_SINWO
MAGKSDDKTRGQKCMARFLDNLLIILIIVALAIGVGLGLGLRSDPTWQPTEKRKIFYLRFPGDLLMNMLKMLILPLIISSLVSSLASLDTRASGRLGVRAVVYYLTTTLAAVIEGIILVLAIQPGTRGKSKDQIERSGKARETQPLDALFDLIRNCFPDNLVSACFEKQGTEVKKLKIQIAATTVAPAATNVTANMTTLATTAAASVMNITTTETPSTTAAYIEVDDPQIVTSSGMNILGLVVFSIFFGITIAKMGKDGKPLLDFFESLHNATMKLVMLVIWYSPIGILFLVAAKLVEMEDISTIFEQIGFYFLTVMAGLFVHGFVVLPLVYLIAVRRNPFVFMYNMLKALLTAWGTASSSATLPITMECLEFRNNIDKRITKFVAPIGATVNMDGTALYEAVAAIFIAQVNGIGLNIGQVITISLTSTAAAIGAAGVPQAGLVTMAIVLTAVDLPIDDITLIIAIDWLLDRFRTAINVLGDAYGAGIVHHLSQDDLRRMDELEAADAAKAEAESVSQTIPDYSYQNGGHHPSKANGVYNHTFVTDLDDPVKF